jgi:hypothetical protein
MVVQVVEQTRDEKIKMYMKLTKREIIDMLLVNQQYVGIIRPQQPLPIPITPQRRRDDPSFPYPGPTCGVISGQPTA